MFTVIVLVLLALLIIAGIGFGVYQMAEGGFFGFVFGWQVVTGGFDLLGQVLAALFAAILDAQK